MHMQTVLCPSLYSRDNKRALLTKIGHSPMCTLLVSTLDNFIHIIRETPKHFVCPSVGLTSNNFLFPTKDLNFTTLSVLISSIRPLQHPLRKHLKHFFVIAIIVILSYPILLLHIILAYHFVTFAVVVILFLHILINCIFVKLAIRRHTLNFFF